MDPVALVDTSKDVLWFALNCLLLAASISLARQNRIPGTSFLVASFAVSSVTSGFFLGWDLLGPRSSRLGDFTGTAINLANYTLSILHFVLLLLCVRALAVIKQ